MGLLQQVQTGKQVAPRRMVLFGVQGIGKSTFAAQSDRPVFIRTEDGVNDIDVPKLPLATTFDEVIAALAELYTEEHPYRTVVLDTLDAVERQIWQVVSRKRGVESIEDIGYAKGYTFALSHWRQLLDGLDALRNAKGMSVILISHSKVERFENPETESYDRYALKLHKTAAAMVQEWADEVLFATYKVYTKLSEDGAIRKKAKGCGTGERILRTTERPFHVAKNRLGLPDELPLDWNEYAKFVPQSEGVKGNG